jgi:hypothetical protein
MRALWPPAEPAQADYERLRDAALAGIASADVSGLRLLRGGLAALIARPVAEAVFAVGIHGASRPPWSPYGDPRLEALAAGYGLLLETAETAGEDQQQEVAR